MLNKYYVHFTEKALNGEFLIPSPRVEGQNLPIAILDAKVFSNGIETMINQNFVKKFADDLRQTQLFSQVYTEPPLERSTKTIEVSLLLKEDNNYHTGLYFLYFVITIITYGIFLFFLKWKTDFTSEMVLTITRFDGSTRQYTAKSSGTVRREIFTDHARATTDLVWQITNNNLRALMNQIITDSPFYLQE